MGTMSIAAADGALARVAVSNGQKKVRVRITGSSSYASGGDTMPDCSTSGNLGQAAGFTYVESINLCGQPTAASDRYYGTYIPSGTFPNYSPTAGLIKLRDINAASDAEPSGDLSTVLWVAEITGR